MMTSLKDNILADLKDAMRARDQKKLNALRLITSAIKQIEVDERIVVDDTRLLVILDKMAKQRNESIQQFKLANRTDLIEQEQFELNIIAQYLPTPLSSDEIEKIINEAIKVTQAEKMADTGKVMKQVQTALRGRADMAQVSALIKAKLS